MIICVFMYHYRVLFFEEVVKATDDYNHLIDFIDLEQSPFIIMTSCLEHLTTLLDTDSRIAIIGPKGTGKSFSLAYVMCHSIQLGKSCILISPQSFGIRLFDYLTRLEKRHGKFIIVTAFVIKRYVFVYNSVCVCVREHVCVCV